MAGGSVRVQTQPAAVSSRLATARERDEEEEEEEGEEWHRLWHLQTPMPLRNRRAIQITLGLHGVEAGKCRPISTLSDVREFGD